MATSQLCDGSAMHLSGLVVTLAADQLQESAGNFRNLN